MFPAASRMIPGVLVHILGPSKGRPSSFTPKAGFFAKSGSFFKNPSSTVTCRADRKRCSRIKALRYELKLAALDKFEEVVERNCQKIYCEQRYRFRPRTTPSPPGLLMLVH